MDERLGAPTRIHCPDYALHQVILSFLLPLLFHKLHTHPQWSHQLSCKAFVKTCDFNNAVFSMLISCSNFFQVCIFIYFFHKLPSVQFILHHMFFLSPPPSAPHLLTLFSKLTWAPSAIFSLSVYLSVCAGAGNSETSPQRTALISSRQTWAKKVQPDSTAEKVPPPRPAWYSYSVHTATPVVCKFLRPSGLQRHVEIMGRG